MARRKKHNKPAAEAEEPAPAAVAKGKGKEATPAPPPAAAAPAAGAKGDGGKFKFNFNFDNKVVPDLQKTAEASKKLKAEDGDESAEEEHEHDDDDEDVIELGGGGDLDQDQMRAMLAQMMQSRLEGLVGRPSGALDDLPKKVKRRLGALRKIQTEQIAVEKQYEAEIRALDVKYQKLYAPLQDKRVSVITGTYEPVDEDIEEKEDAAEDEEEEEEPPAKGKGKKGGKGKEESAEEEDDTVGVPEFWLSCLQNNPDVNDMITDDDEEALRFLTDVRVDYPADDTKGFRLEFTFAENPFFVNRKLTKTYFFTDDAMEAVFDHAEGCDIMWKKKKDLTRKGQAQTFFTFFTPPEMPEKDELEGMDPADAQELGQQLQEDFVVGETIKTRVIPRALLWFTGEALEEGDFDMFGEGDDEDGEHDEDDDEDEDDEDCGHGHSHGGHGHSHGGHGHSHGGHGHSHGGGGGKKKGKKIEEIDSDADEEYVPPAKPGDKPAECKQQ